MKSPLSTIVLFYLAICNAACNSEKSEKNTSILVVDSSIKHIALQKIWNRDSSYSNCVFSSRLNAQFFQNDQLDQEFKDSIDETFWGRYWWQNDTLTLTGNSGVLSSSGFIAHIYKNSTADIYVNQCAHETPRYKVNETDTLSVCIKVPCQFAELKISAFPDSTKDEVLYGFVNFKSNDYYYHVGKEKTKLRTNMSFYFKACNYEYYLKKLRRNVP